MKQIEAFLRTQIDKADETLLKAVTEVAYIRTLKKGDYLIKCGEHPKGLCFLLNGLFRGFFLDNQGNEVTDCISFRYGATLMPSADYTVPAPISIIAMEDSQVLVVPLQTALALLRENPAGIEIYNRLMCTGVAEQWEIKTALYQYTAAQRYEWFLERYEGIIDRVPHVHIASFLGVTPVTLSRLRSKRKENANKG